MDGGQLGVWDWKLKKGTIDYNKGIPQVLGYRPEEVEASEAWWRSRIHPADREIVDQALTAHLNGEAEYFKTEYRFKTRDGNWKWLYDHGRLADAERGGQRLVGVVRDVDGRRRAQKALVEERDVFARGPVVVFKLSGDETSKIEYVSENVEEVLGYSSEEVLAKGFTGDELIHPEDVKRVYEESSRARQGGQNSITMEPYRMLTKEGEVRWVQDNTRFVWENGTLSHHICYIVDITERRQKDAELRRTLAEKEALLQEVHHRVKNNLQVVSSLLQMQKYRLQDREVSAAAIEALEESSQRIFAMAEVHRETYRTSNPDQIDPESYFTRLVESTAEVFADDSNYNIQMNFCANVKLHSNQAIYCGLILNELVANSFQHAAVNSEDELRLETGLVEKDDNLTLYVRDNGRGFVDYFSVEESDSLGLQLVRLLAEEQLVGELVFKKQPSTEFAVIFSPSHD